VNTTYAYDPISRLTSILHKLGTTTLDGATYTYDNAGNRKTRTDKRLNTTLTYGYDNIYQLLSAKQGATTKETYTYDIVGNRLSSIGVSPYSYNSSNELTALPSGSYGYDNNGNTKTKPDGTQYTWDYDNRLTQVGLPGAGGTVKFKYDPFGRRIQKAFTQNGATTTTNYVYDGPNILETLDNSGNVLSRYAQGKGIDEPLAELISGTTSYYEQDGLGSATSLSNSSGALANTYTYDSYGKLTASTGTTFNPFQYTAREFDGETGAYFYRARYYDQNVGRFVTEDPLHFRANINFYGYVLNNPLRWSDPDGRKINWGNIYDSLENGRNSLDWFNCFSRGGYCLSRLSSTVSSVRGDASVGSPDNPNSGASTGFDQLRATCKQDQNCSKTFCQCLAQGQANPLSPPWWFSALVGLDPCKEQ
jgi:RHS repeat-associated protein